MSDNIPASAYKNLPKKFPEFDEEHVQYLAKVFKSDSPHLMRTERGSTISASARDESMSPDIRKKPAPVDELFSQLESTLDRENNGDADIEQSPMELQEPPREAKESFFDDVGTRVELSRTPTQKDTEPKSSSSQSSLQSVSNVKQLHAESSSYVETFSFFPYAPFVPFVPLLVLLFVWLYFFFKSIYV